MTYDNRCPHSSVEKIWKRLINQSRAVGPIRVAPAQCSHSLNVSAAVNRKFSRRNDL